MPEEVVMAPMDGILVEQVLVNLMENSAIHGKQPQKYEYPSKTAGTGAVLRGG
ncbi:MAG: hypothetical protein ACLURV_09030 [Gallintestinimicrobium sp.]